LHKVEHGVADKENVLLVAGAPHAQVVRVNFFGDLEELVRDRGI